MSYGSHILIHCFSTARTLFYPVHTINNAIFLPVSSSSTNILNSKMYRELCVQYCNFAFIIIPNTMKWEVNRLVSVSFNVRVRLLQPGPEDELLNGLMVQGSNQVTPDTKKAGKSKVSLSEV